MVESGAPQRKAEEPLTHTPGCSLQPEACVILGLDSILVEAFAGMMTGRRTKKMRLSLGTKKPPQARGLEGSWSVQRAD